MDRQDYVYLVHIVKNANDEMKKIRRKFNREKSKILKLKLCSNKTERREIKILFFSPHHRRQIRVRDNGAFFSFFNFSPNFLLDFYRFSIIF